MFHNEKQKGTQGIAPQGFSNLPFMEHVIFFLLLHRLNRSLLSIPILCLSFEFWTVISPDN